MKFCVQVKNKPCVRCTSNMRLISWIHPRGSETEGKLPTNSCHTNKTNMLLYCLQWGNKLIYRLLVIGFIRAR